MSAFSLPVRPPLPWIALGVILCIAAWLRLQQFSAQWLTDDEWHAVHQIVQGMTYSELLSTVSGADYSIPQTLAYKYLADHVGLNEILMRLPMLLAGLLLVVGGAAWAWHRFSPLAGFCFGLLLASSPLLVNYSRTARPYALTVLLAWLALLALVRWREEHQGGWAACHAACAVLGCWLHMVVAPFILAPLGWVLLGEAHAAWRAKQRSRLVQAGILGLTVSVGVGLLALRPMWLGRAELAARIGKDLPTGDTYVGVWHIWFGTESATVVIIGLLFALAGLRLLARREPRLLAMAALGMAATLAGIYLSRPAWVHNALTFGRYMLPGQPLLLLCVALGMADLLQRISQPAWRGAGAALLPALFLIGSPHTDLLRRPNNFSLHYWYQFDYRTSQNPVREMGHLPVHPFWSRLADMTPGSLRIAVAGHGLESYTIYDVYWQHKHRQQVVNTQLWGYCGWPPYYGEALPRHGFFLHNAVTLADSGDLVRKRIDYVVFDRKGAREVESCIARFRDEHGAPAYEDDRLVAFKLDDRH